MNNAIVALLYYERVVMNIRILDIRAEKSSIELKKSFKTALRTLDVIDTIIVKVITKDIVGYGAASPTEVITGDTSQSIMGAINHIKRYLIGKDIRNFEDIMITLNKCIVGNTSAKAAIDIAIYDLLGKLYNAPVYRLLGGYKTKLITDITISLNPVEEMVSNSIDAINNGFSILKIKLGDNSYIDFKRIQAIREAVGKSIKLRVDANQGWKPKEAINIIKKMEAYNLNIDFIEQPVDAKNLDDLKYVTDNVSIPILADESVFSPVDAMKLINMKASDMINIKLMKTGGIYNALKIINLAEVSGMKCMIGSMMESNIGITAAAHLAASKANVTEVDLDVPLLCKESPIIGGVTYKKDEITLNNRAGFGMNFND
jgi:o-succinylbenzoate synthase